LNKRSFVSMLVYQKSLEGQGKTGLETGLPASDAPACFERKREEFMGWPSRYNPAKTDVTKD